MNSQERAAIKVQPSFKAEKANIVYTDVFENKKKKQDYELALKRILERANKTNW